MMNPYYFIYYIAYWYGKNKAKVGGRFGGNTSIALILLFHYLSLTAMLEYFNIPYYLPKFQFEGYTAKQSSRLGVGLLLLLPFLGAYFYFNRHRSFRVLLKYHRRFKGKTWQMLFWVLVIVVLPIVVTAVLSKK